MKKKITYALLAVLVLIQLYRPDITPLSAAQAGSDLYAQYPDAPTVIRGACYDCHSNESVLPWYGHVNPMGILVRNHILEGREHLNFSSIGELAAAERAEVFHECDEEVSKEKMPMKAYTWIHGHARLSTEERSELASWFRSVK